MNTPYIDVIIAVYNGEKYIKEAIASVQDQSWKNVNIIVADDGSTDQTLSIISALSRSDNRIKVQSYLHKGVSATLNAALQSSTNPYIAFLDADDLWHKDKLKEQMHILMESNARICFCLMQEFETFEQGAMRSHSARLEPLKGYSKIAFLGERSLFDTFGVFNENIAIGDFVEWYSRVVRAEEPIEMLEQVLAYRRVHQNNVMRDAPKGAFLKLLKTHLDEKRKSVE
jgi:glycosyltransferase involved in cell wall biosynthesis